ncbi:MAG: DUF547 domain-containing protein [Saprospiraceae bacterium]|nr:DUF547 domain-containing protein [Saprospiraceae bacterium]
MKTCLLCLLSVYSIICFSQDVAKLNVFEAKMDEFLAQYVVDGFVDYEQIKISSENLTKLVTSIAEMDNSNFNDAQKIAFYINSYNLLVIDQIVSHYPSSSVKDIPGFFDRIKYRIASKEMTLNTLEKELLLKAYKDSRFHFVLVCGAKDCPKLWDKSYKADIIEEQLENRSREVLNDPIFLKETDRGIGLSEIFKWNRFEFDGKKGAIRFINGFRNEQINLDSDTYYYDYDWTLNDVRFANNGDSATGNNSYRYVTSASIPKGGIEVKLFNNLYSQVEGQGNVSDLRSTYFTSSLSFLYGTSNRFNIGFAARYRRVFNASLPSSPFNIFESLSAPDGRQRISAFGPQIRWAPIEAWSNFSIQSQFTFPLGSQLSGSENSPFLDWAGPVFWTQFFNDKSIGDKFSLFTEIDLLIEEIGGAGKANRVSTPMTVILSYFPIKNVTLYGLAGYSPYLASPYDYFTQFGLGAKFQLSPNFEIEFLATDFSNKYLNSINGSAATYNFGLRYSR